MVFLDALWHPPHLRFSANTDSYGSRSAARVEANGIACRALLPSPLHCRKRTVCGSGAVFCVALFPLSHLLLRRSFRLCEWRLRGQSGGAERAAQREKRVASVCVCVSVRATEVRGRAAVRACCARCAWRMLAILGAGEAHARRQSRWCAARRVRRPWWRARWRATRFDRMIRAARRVPMGARAGPGCSLGHC